MTPQNQPRRTSPDDALAKLNDLMGVFDGIEPWKGEVPKGRVRTFIGALSPIEPWDRGRTLPDGTEYQETELPRVTGGEHFFEWVSMLMAIRGAQRSFTMVSLGAHFGGPLVNAALALRKLNPMPCQLVGVEADPNMCAMLEEHFRENGIDPKDHWIINTALSDSNRPVVFPVSELRPGSNSAVHSDDQRRVLLGMINRSGQSEAILKNIVLEASPRIYLPLDSPEGTPEAAGELRFVSTNTVADIFHPLAFVDYLDIDIQMAEAYVLPPAIEMLNRKVRWLHLGTHGLDIHKSMCEMFVAHGWEILLDFTPGSKFDSVEGPFETCDGVLFAYNPALEGFGP